jgi:hypothetical protein
VKGNFSTQFGRHLRRVAVYKNGVVVLGSKNASDVLARPGLWTLIWPRTTARSSAKNVHDRAAVALRHLDGRPQGPPNAHDSACGCPQRRTVGQHQQLAQWAARPRVVVPGAGGAPAAASCTPGHGTGHDRTASCAGLALNPTTLPLCSFFSANADRELRADPANRAEMSCVLQRTAVTRLSSKARRVRSHSRLTPGTWVHGYM